MKIQRFREYRGGDAEKYLSVDLSLSLRDLFLNLSNLSFEDNFSAFIENVTIAAGTEIKIRNQLKVIPSSKIILRDYGSNTIVDGDTEWTQDYVYLKNIGMASARAKVLFLR